MIRKSSIRKLTLDKVNSVLASILEPEGFKYYKSKSEYKWKDGNFESLFTTQIPFEAIRYNDELDRYILWFELYSYLESSKFDKWFKKNTKNQIRVYSKTKQFEGYIILEKEDLKNQDFFEPSEIQEFKHETFTGLKGEKPQIGDANTFDLIKSGEMLLVNESENLKSNCNLNSFLEIEKNVVFNRFHVSFLDVKPYLYTFTEDVEMAKIHFKRNYIKYVSIVPALRKEYPHEVNNFVDFFESFILDAKNLVNIEFPNSTSEMIKKIRN